MAGSWRGGKGCTAAGGPCVSKLRRPFHIPHTLAMGAISTAMWHTCSGWGLAPTPPSTGMW
jgi:hypothetical protein